MESEQAVKTFIARCRAKRLSERTITWYQWILGQFSRRFPELLTKPEEIEAYLAEVKGGDETVHGYYRALRALYNFLERRQGAPNPMRMVEAPRRKRKQPRVLDVPEQAMVLALAWCQRDRAILTLLLDTGIRVGELASLRAWDIRSESIVVRGKTGEREVPISEELPALLEGLGDGYHVFIGAKGPLTHWGLRRIVRKYLKAAGLQGNKLGPHTLRHTSATQYIENGGDPFSLQEILGHSTLEMVRRYVQMAKEKVKRQHAQYSALRSLPPGNGHKCPKCGGTLIHEHDDTTVCLNCGWREAEKPRGGK